MRRTFVLISAMFLVMTGAIPATATTDESLKVTQVLVSRLGGITASGTVDCSYAVNALRLERQR